MMLRIGKKAEKLAEKHLQKNGLKLIERNFYSRMGEIDLIMQDGEVLVFVEVRSRKSRTYGGSLASITVQKQQKIIKTAYNYLQKKQLFDKHPFRFDVVGIDGESSQIQWLKHAFYA